MIRKQLTGLLILLLAVLTAAGTVAAKKKSFDDLCLEILEDIQSFYPVRSTEMGIHAYDHRLADYSSASVKKMIKKMQSHEKQLHRYKSADLSDYNRINYRLIKANVDIALLDLKGIAWHRKSPRLYVREAVDGIYFLMLSRHAPLSEKVVPLVARMRAVPQLFETARRNLKEPPPIYIEAALESLESGMQFYQQVAGELMNKLPERADKILAVSTRAREAMNDFATWLSQLPTGSPTAFAIGKNNFDYKLSHEYFLTIDADSLLRIGEALLAEAQRVYHDYETYIEANHQKGRDSVFVPAAFTKNDIIDYYNWETRQVKVFLQENNILTVPEDMAPVTVIETPPFLRSMVSGIAYQPAGPFDSLQQGYFYIRPVPDNLERRQLEARYRYVHRRGFRGSVVHEAYPGHHLQFQIAGLNDDPVRKWQLNNMMIEGWALYCEEMMYHVGLYGESDPPQWLAILGGIRFRAARIVADVKLHTGQFTYDECVAWMIDVLEISSESGREYIRKEVRRYTFRPTYQMSYLMGKREIMALRRAAEARDGDRFSLKAFHDALLAEGLIPPTLMWKILGLSNQ